MRVNKFAPVVFVATSIGTAVMGVIAGANAADSVLSLNQQWFSTQLKATFVKGRAITYPASSTSGGGTLTTETVKVDSGKGNCFAYITQPSTVTEPTTVIEPSTVESVNFTLHNICVDAEGNFHNEDTSSFPRLESLGGVAIGAAEQVISFVANGSNDSTFAYIGTFILRDRSKDNNGNNGNGNDDNGNGNSSQLKLVTRGREGTALFEEAVTQPSTIDGPSTIIEPTTIESGIISFGPARLSFKPVKDANDVPEEFDICRQIAVGEIDFPSTLTQPTTVYVDCQRNVSG